MLAFLKKRRALIERELQDPMERRFFSPSRYAEYLATMPALRSYARGAVIDIGCGLMPYRESVLALPGVIRYDGLDREMRVHGVSIVGDAQDMSMVAEASYDCAVCLLVLEHLPEPLRALKEIRRILKPRGTLILSAPHVSRLHEEPFDYYRFTKYGLRYLLEQAGFEDVEIRPWQAGLLSYIGHQVSTIAVCLCRGVPVLRQAVWFLNLWLVVRPCVWLDGVLDRKHLFTIAYTCVARKGIDSRGIGTGLAGASGASDPTTARAQ